MKILVTGAAGFVGRHLTERLRKNPAHDIVAVQRRVEARDTTDVDRRAVEINPNTDWSNQLEDVDVVIHLAARAHILKETQADALSVFRRENVESTLNLAKQAAQYGVRRLIFLSSIGVHGAETIKPFTAQDVPHPHSNYAIAKLEAEGAVLQAAQFSDMKTVIVRAPLIYGSHAPGNFSRLVRLVRTGLPLPLGSLRNRRSLLGVDNLVDLLVLCVEHPAAVGQIFLAADQEPISTPDMLRQIAAGLGKPVVLIPFPPSLLGKLAALMGKDALRIQLCGSLEVDIAHTRQTLGWVPRVATPQGIAEAVAAYTFA